MQPLKVVICWSEISGYMAACWRALAARADLDLFVLAYRSGVRADEAAFADGQMAGINRRLLALEERHDLSKIAPVVKERRPDVVAFAGWINPAYNRLAADPELAGVKRVAALDAPRQYNLKQQLTRLKVFRHLRRMDRVVVAGERAWQFARFLGVPEAGLRRGMYSIDYDLFAPSYAARIGRAGGWPKRFLFIGRYMPVKAVDVLVEAYRAYRAHAGAEAWPLTCCGMGPLKHLLGGVEGLEDRGFMQPGELPKVFAEHGALVLPSRYDPWPLVVAEACAAGLPVVCTEACGSAVELVRSYYNGLAVATGDVAAMAGAMRWMHENHQKLPMMGQRGQQLAAAYTPQLWADRWGQMFRELCGRG